MSIISKRQEKRAVQAGLRQKKMPIFSSSKPVSGVNNSVLCSSRLFTHASSQSFGLSHACLFRYFLFIFSRRVTFFCVLPFFSLCPFAWDVFLISFGVDVFFPFFREAESLRLFVSFFVPLQPLFKLVAPSQFFFRHALILLCARYR